MLRKLLNTINLKWAQKQRINKTISVQRGIGNHPYLTIREGSVFFHAYPQVESFGGSTKEIVNTSAYTGMATTQEQSIAFRADFIEEIRNRGTEDIYINFNELASEGGRITLKPGDVVTDFPRKVQTLFFYSAQGEQEFSILGTYTNMLYYQEVVLEGMTIQDLTNTLTDMGYQVDTTEAARLNLLEESALILLDTNGQALADWCDLYAFSSNWYRVLYPIHRILTKFDGDVDTAIEQLFLPSTNGEWLDYWASFFRIKRLPDETDAVMLRRVLLTLTSTKSNNKAMEELISYYIGAVAQVLDSEPALIEVRVDSKFMGSATKVKDIVVLLKSAGVDYFINYQNILNENYPAYFMNRYGKSFGTLNETFSKVTVTLPVYAEDYLYVPAELRNGFRLNTSCNLTSSSLHLARIDKKVVESLGMIMKDSSGNVIQQM